METPVEYNVALLLFELSDAQVEQKSSLGHPSGIHWTREATFTWTRELRMESTFVMNQLLCVAAMLALVLLSELGTALAIAGRRRFMSTGPRVVQCTLPMLEERGGMQASTTRVVYVACILISYSIPVADITSQTYSVAISRNRHHQVHAEPLGRAH
ncbi:hypothetical protein LSAT2_030060 [Lamellibrachia satsuma]|nr:hypothetical protein LSAT2_030060 [Lamellibrachia satsuma]